MKTKKQAAADKARDWFKDSLFNLLVDYYPEVTCRPYGSGATRENVLPVLKKIKPGFIAIYAKGHSGRTTFKSALRTEHAMLAKDMPDFFRKATREAGIKLFLYYSGLVDGIAIMRHPEWAMVGIDGKPCTETQSVFMTLPVCPQSRYFEEWAAVHVREMITRYDPDGIWVDGDWPGPCYCEKCRARFRRETGFKDVPGIGMTVHNVGQTGQDINETPEAFAWRRVWNMITQEYRRKFQALVKELKPTCLYSAGNINPRKEFADLFDWRSGDCFSPKLHRIYASLFMRRYTVQGRPHEAMTCDTSFVHGWDQMRSRTKTLPRMLQEGATVLANGGQWCYWTYPMPNGAFVPSKMAQAIRAKEFTALRRDVFLRNESVNWTAVLGVDHPSVVPSEIDDNVFGAGKALLALHRSPDLIDESSILEHPYDLIVVPEQANISPAIAARLERFVKKGGKLLTTGATLDSPAMQKLAGLHLRRKAKLGDGHVFLKDKRPAGVYAPWDEVELAGAKALYPLYRSWDDDNVEMRRFSINYPITGMVDEEHPEPAGMPGATLRKVGLGTILHVPTKLFSTYWTYGYPDILAWVRELLGILQPDPFFRTDALSFVEIALRRKADRLLVHFVNGNPGRDFANVHRTNFDLWVDDIPTIGPITCRIKCPRKPRSVYAVPGQGKIPWSWKAGELQATLPRLEIHACLVVDGQALAGHPARIPSRK